MLESIKWKGQVEMNGNEYESMEQALQVLKGYSGDVCIVLRNNKKPQTRKISRSQKE